MDPLQLRAANAVESRRLRKGIQDIEAKAGYIDLQSVALERAKGRSEVTVCGWVWEKQWCPITSAEWYTPPLTASQAYHLTYLMDMNTAFIRKIGLQNLPIKPLK